MQVFIDRASVLQNARCSVRQPDDMAKTKMKQWGIRRDDPVSASELLFLTAKRRTSTARIASRIQEDGEPWCDAIRRATQLENEIYPLAREIRADGESRETAVLRAKELVRLVGGRMHLESTADFVLRAVQFESQGRGRGDEADSQDSPTDRPVHYFTRDGQWFAERQGYPEGQKPQLEPVATGIFCPQQKHFLFVLAIFACAYVKWCV